MPLLLPIYRYVAKRAVLRLLELAPTVRGSQDVGSRNLGPTFLTIPVKRVQEDGLDPAPELVALAYFKMKEHFEEIPDDIAKTVRLRLIFNST